MYPEIAITMAMWQSAYEKSVEQGKLKNSFKDRNITGFLGEELYQHIAPDAKRCNTFDYDFILRESKIDVKARNTVCYPRKEFEFSVIRPREKQDFDYYVFTAIRNSGTVGYILGYLSKEDFYRVSVKRGNGESFAQGRNAFTEDCRVVKFSDIKPFPENILRAVSNGR